MPFPYLDENQSVRFPSLDEATPEGVVAVGGNLSPGMLLSAYRQGIFPWFSDDEEPILWWSPDPRYVLFVDELSVPKRLTRSLKKLPFDITFDSAFNAVIRSCATVFRPREMGTWITAEMFRAYTRLHELGYAHSVEAWRDGELAGGLYGVCLGGVFYGESMFHRTTNASKAAFVALVRGLEAHGVRLIDCQMETPLLSSFGARYIPREEFAGHLIALLAEETRRGSWKSWSPAS